MESKENELVVTLGERETNWYSSVSNYLYKDDGWYDPDLKRSLNPLSFVKDYRGYNLQHRDEIKNKPGALKINDLWFAIPPEAISVSMSNNTIDIPQIRSKHSVKIDSGYGEIVVNISLVFADNPLLVKGRVGVSDEIRYKLIPLLTQLRAMPFCHVKNEYLKKRIVDALSLKFDNDADLDRIDLMLTYLSHTLYPDPESPGIVRANFQFLLFNYAPYMNNLLYVGKYKRLKKGLIDRDFDNKPESPTCVLNPEESEAFLEFYAPEFDRLQAKAKVQSYNHATSNDVIEFQYYTYIEIARKALSDEQIKTVNSTTDGVFSNDPVEGISTVSKKGGFKEFAHALGQRESGASKDQYAAENDLGYIGKYQFGAMRLWDLGYRLGNYIPNTPARNDIGSKKQISRDAFKIDHALQERLFVDHVNKWIKDIKNAINSGELKYGDIHKKAGITLSGLVAGAHLKGLGNSTDPGLKHFINNSNDNKDGYGTKISEYVTKFSGYKLDDSEQIFDLSQTLAMAGKELAEAAQKATTTKQDSKEFNNVVENQKTALQKILEALPKGTYTFVQPDEHSHVVYLKILNTYAVPLHGMLGVELVGLESQGMNEIPRIPLQGYRFATHQYMGGHIEKVSINFTVFNDVGDEALTRIQKIINIIGNNAIRFQTVASLDGLTIKHPFINTVQGGERFIVDSLITSTHQQIPGGSTVMLNLTDYTKTKEHVERTMKFDQERLGNLNKYFKDILQEVFKYSSFGIHCWISKKDRPAPATFESAFAQSLNSVDKILNIYWDANGLKDKEESVATAIKALIESLNGMSHKWFPDIINSLSQLGKDKIDRNALIQNDRWDVLGLINQEMKDYLSSKGAREDFSTVLDSWVQKYQDIFCNYFPHLKEKYTEEVKNNFNKITTPAYIDFDLPPTIGPDYYFYQPRKYAGADNSEKWTRAENRYKEDLKKRFSLYHQQLKASQYGSTDKNILKQLGITEEDAKTMVIQNLTSKDEEFTATNLASDPVNQDMFDWGMYKSPHRYPEIAKKDEIGNELYRAKSLIGNVGTAESPAVPQAVVYSNTESFVEKLFYSHTKNECKRISQLGMEMAFPVYKIYIIEEDDTDTLAPLRKDLNEMYGLNAVAEINLAELHDQPISVLTVRFIDLTGRFTAARFKEKPGQESLDPKDIDTSKENPLEGIMIKEGTRIKLHVGFTNNVNELPVKFNGQVASIEGDNNEYTMICQSFGAELVYDVKFPEKPKDITDWNSETKEILQWAITQPEVLHFGRWKLTSVDNLIISDSTQGVRLGMYYNRVRPDGKTQRTWTHTKELAEMNILAPEESNFKGLMNIWQAVIEDPVGTVWNGHPLNVFGDRNLKNRIWESYWIYKKTLWEIIDDMTYRYPSYVAAVLPFEDRCTLYYGPPDGSYFYRSMSFSEQEIANKYLRDKKTDIEWARKIADQVADAGDDFKAKIVFDPGVGGYVSKRDDSAGERLAELLPFYERAKRIIAKSEAYRYRLIKPFRQYWVADKNIVRNSIKADYRDVFNMVNIVRGNGSEPNEKESSDMVTLKMNDFLQDEDIRATTIYAPNAQTNDAAYKYGAHELMRQARKLYKGDLIMIGNPEIKPYDIVYVFDDHTQMHGPVEVREHILSITPQGGMISSIVPGMVSYMNDMVGMSNMDALGSFLAGTRGQDMLERIVGGFAPVGLGVGAAGAAGATATGLAGIVGGTALSAGSFIVLPAIAIGMMSLAPKLFYAAKNRNPIYLSPLMRNGIPFIVGMNTYKVAGLLEWVENEWKIFTDGLDDYSTVLSSAMNQVIDFF